VRPQLLRSVLRQTLRPADPAGDAELLRRVAAGRDEAAFAEIVRRHARLVWGVCRNLLPGEADAEDAFQATFLALVRSADRVRDGNALGGWLHGTAVRVCRQARRAAARRKRRERAGAVGEATVPVADAAWDALLAAVHAEVCRLPDAQRVPFVLCCLEGRGVSEAAAELGWKLGTFSARLTRAKQTLLARLARRGVAPGAAAVAAAGGATAAAPARLVDAAVGLARAGGPVAESVLHLTAGVTDMALTKTKLLAAGVILAAAVGVSAWSARVPAAGAQDPTPAAGPFGPPADPSAAGTAYHDAVEKAYQLLARQAAAGGHTRWEYKYVNFGEADYEKKANELGKAGWEMVGPVGGTNFFFKRPAAVVEQRIASAPLGDAAEAGVMVFRLKHGDAWEVAQSLGRLFQGQQVRVTALPQRNEIMVYGPDKAVKAIRELIGQLDKPEDSTGRPATKR